MRMHGVFGCFRDMWPSSSRTARPGVSISAATTATRLPFPSSSFDLVVHSDTLEHVTDPRKGLEECRRIVSDQGALVFTVPVIVGRLTRARDGMPPSYHGHEGCVDPGMLVHTEFGADVWALVVQAGFSSCELLPYLAPAGLAIVARP